MEAWVEINEDLCGRYHTKCQIRFKSTMLLLSLSEYANANVLVKGAISVVAAAGAASKNNNKNGNNYKFVLHLLIG